MPVLTHCSMIFGPDGIRLKHSPFVEACFLNVALKSLVFNDELHSFKEGSCHGGRLFSQQDVQRLRDSVTELAVLTNRVFATLGIFAVNQPIWNMVLKISTASPPTASCCYAVITLIIVLAVGAVLFQVNVTAFAEPPVLADALPITRVWADPALSLVIATIGAATQCAVFSVIPCKMKIAVTEAFTEKYLIMLLPFVHKQVPLEHIPWSWHLGSHSFSLQPSPDHPSWQTQRPDSQSPWGPQSRLQRSEINIHNMIYLQQLVSFFLKLYVTK